MPKATHRIFEDCRKDMERYAAEHHLFPSLENTPDLLRGETRLAAEVALTIISGAAPPPEPNEAKAFEAARIKAYETLRTLARG